MKTTVSKWGNSLAVRIPLPLAEALGIRDGSTVDLGTQKGALVIKKPRFTLEELLATYDGPESEYDWGAPQGREVW